MPSPWHGPVHLIPTAPFLASVGIGCFDGSYGLWRVCCCAAGVCSLPVVAICSLLRTNAAVGMLVCLEFSKSTGNRKSGQLGVALRGKDATVPPWEVLQVNASHYKMIETELKRIPCAAG